MSAPARLNSTDEPTGAQGHHGIEGRRPRPDLTGEERTERRRQQEDWRSKNRIPPKKTRTSKSRKTNWAQEHVEIWGKPPGVPLTPEEFAEREPLWNARVLATIEEAEGYEARKLARRELRRAGRERSFPPPVAPAVGRNSPCPCGSGHKFKRCCGG